MVGIFSTRQPAFALPASGSLALAFGNSISDIQVGLSQWFDTVCANYGWVPMARNMLFNPEFEGGVSAWTTTAGTLVRDTGVVLAGTGSGKLSCNSGGVAPYTSPFNGALDAQGDAGGVRLGIQASYWYRVSCLMRVPSGNTANSGVLYMTSKVGAGAYVNSTMATCAADSTTRTISTIYQMPAGITEAFMRVQSNDTTLNHFISFDNVNLERFAADPTGLPLGTYGHYNNRAAITGTILQNNDATANNGRDNRAARVDAYVPDIVFVMYSENDLYYTAGAGAVTPITLATWRTNLNSVLGSIHTNLPNAKIVVLGSSRTTWQFQGGAATVAIATAGSAYTTDPTPVFSASSGGSGATGTTTRSGNTVLSVAVTAAGVGYHVGDAVTFTGGGGSGATGTIASLTNGIPPFSAVDMDDAVQQMNNIAKQETRNVGGLFIPLRQLMNDDMVQTPANTNGKHPTITGGMRQIASIVIAALDGGI